MFQFSKTMEPQSRRTAKTAEQYFIGWVTWFKSRGILTEIRYNRKGASLWRAGEEAKERNTRKFNKKENLK